MDILVVIDMQNDFIDGALGTPEAEAIVPNVVDRVKNFNGLVLATRDTHGGDYLQTQEGRMLPVEHCIRGTYGWRSGRRSQSSWSPDPLTSRPLAAKLWEKS